MPKLMPFTLVLTSPPGRAALTSALVEQALAALSQSDTQLDLKTSTPKWLAADEAWEHSLTAPAAFDPAAAATLIRGAIAPAPIDVNIIPGPPQERRKKLLIADMDSTIINQECIDEIADHIGIGAKVSAITERAMRGDLDFDTALVERVELLAGMSEAELQNIFEARITLMAGARTLIQTMRQHGTFCALVSGGFDFFTSRIASLVGFNVTQANALEMTNAKLTGKVVMPILGRQAKLDALQDYAAGLDLPLSASLAVGDGANDLAMIKSAGLGVAYHAKPIVAAEADASIIHGDLTTLLYLQGYAKNEFVT